LAPDGTRGSPLASYAKAVTSLAWGDGGGVLFSASRSGVVTRSVVAGGASVSARVGVGRSFALRWSPDGSVVATGGDDGALRLCVAAGFTAGYAWFWAAGAAAGCGYHKLPSGNRDVAKARSVSDGERTFGVGGS
jgi:hypothetical protein